VQLIGFEKEKQYVDRKHIVNPNTDKVENFLYKGDKIVRKKSIDSFKGLKQQESESGLESWKIKEFSKANTEELKLVLKELSATEKAFLISISPYTAFDSNLLQTGRGKNAKDIGTEDLIDITGLSRNTVYETIDSLFKKDIIYKGVNSRNRQYFVNPWLYCKGNRINKVLKVMFKNYKVRSRSNTPWKDLEGF